MDCVCEAIVENDHAPGLRQPMPEDQIDEHVIEQVAAVNEREVETPPLPYQFGQQKLRGLFFDLDEFLEARFLDISSARAVILDGFIRIDHEMRAGPSAVLEQSFEDEERRQSPRHTDLERARSAFRNTDISDERAAVGRNACRGNRMLGSILSANDTVPI